MCSKIAEATLNVPALRFGLSASQDPPEGIRLDSAFALQCAGQAFCLDVRSNAFKVRGVAAFAAAGKQLNNVQVVCTSILEAAQASCLLGYCSTVTALSLSGDHMPAVLPRTVTKLTAKFSPPAACGCDTTQPDALIHHAAFLPQLRRLELLFSRISQPSAVLLQACIRLPSLQSLRISTIWLSAPEIDLKWVQHQPCSRLELVVGADTADIAKHAVIVKQLIHMAPSSHSAIKLSLDMKVPFTLELQALWSGLRVMRFDLYLTADTWAPLQMLPRCSELHLGCSGDDYSAQISWQALSSRAARILVNMNGELHVTGAGSSAPDNLDQPWQLGVICASSICGLPASQPAKHCRYLLQNAAARAAGWDEWFMM